MLKMLATDDTGRKLIIIGLTRKSINEMAKNPSKWASFDLSNYGYDVQLSIAFGEDDAALSEQFSVPLPTHSGTGEA